MNRKAREIGDFLIDAWKNAQYRIIDERCEKERQEGLINAINCMIDLNVSEDEIINKITLYWDIKPSFVKKVIDGEKYRVNNKMERKFYH